jgi:hypothetical protein
MASDRNAITEVYLNVARGVIRIVVDSDGIVIHGNDAIVITPITSQEIRVEITP